MRLSLDYTIQYNNEVKSLIFIQVFEIPQVLSENNTMATKWRSRIWSIITPCPQSCQILMKYGIFNDKASLPWSGALFSNPEFITLRQFGASLGTDKDMRLGWCWNICINWHACTFFHIKIFYWIAAAHQHAVRAIFRPVFRDEGLCSNLREQMKYWLIAGINSWANAIVCQNKI